MTYTTKQTEGEYQVLNTSTGKVQSCWGSYRAARETANALNRMAEKSDKARLREMKANG